MRSKRDGTSGSKPAKKSAPKPASGGLVKSFFAGGSLESVGRYLDGRRHGPWKFYLRNGKLRAWGKLDRGRLVGMWKWNAENGVLRQAGSFNANGNQHGLWKRCFGGTGVVCDVGRYEDGKRVGLWKFFKKDGSLLRTKEFGQRARK